MRAEVTHGQWFAATVAGVSSTAPAPSAPAACAGIVLAAGAGTRYGMPKALAEDGAWLRAAASGFADAPAPAGVL